MCRDPQGLFGVAFNEMRAPPTGGSFRLVARNRIRRVRRVVRAALERQGAVAPAFQPRLSSIAIGRRAAGDHDRTFGREERQRGERLERVPLPHRFGNIRVVQRVGHIRQKDPIQVEPD